MENEKLHYLVIQPTSLCNLNCKYCYVPDRKESGKITEEILHKIFKKTLSSAILQGSLVVNWHAGEPLTMGMDFYKSAIDICNCYNTRNLKITHMIQTNGVLLDEKWCVFIKDKDIQLRVSIDGPEFIHDKYRKTWKNTGSFKHTIKGIENLKKHNIPVSTISVLTKNSLLYPEEMFEFFYNLGSTDIQFNLEEIEGENTNSSVLSHSENNVFEQYQDFYEKFLTLFLSMPKRFVFRDFNRITNHIENIKCDKFYSPIQLQSTDKAMITILKNGDVTTYGPELASGTSKDPQKFVLGNISEITFIDDIFKTIKFKSMQKQIAKGIRLCQKECAYYKLCGGGNPANKFYEKNTFEVSETQYCKLHEQLFSDILLNQLEKKESYDSLEITTR